MSLELLAINSLDGRYRDDVKELVPFSSEKALQQQRLRVEIEYFIKLEQVDLPEFSEDERKRLRSVYQNLSDEDAQLIKDIETKGVPGINGGKPAEHDVKALEYFMKHKFRNDISFEHRMELFHVFLTSEDVNNIAYSVMLKDGVQQCLVPALVRLEERLLSMAETYREMPMPGRTHGQYAIPTTVGKELAIFAERIGLQLEQLCNMKLRGKLNGAIGNYSSFRTQENVNWEGFSKGFVESFGLEHNPFTTQIEPHDSMADMFQKITHINSIILGLDQDMWGYISDEYFVQKRVEGEVGSSTMPQKINPIKFENSEGNLGAANALLVYLSGKLPISRFQRDLSDSTAQRWVGTALGASLLAYKNALRGLNKVEPNEARLSRELDEHWEVLAEPIQQMLRLIIVPGAYDILKKHTQGKVWKKEDIVSFVEEARLVGTTKDKILALTPHNYIGDAPKLTTDAIQRVRTILDSAKKVYEVK